MISEMWREMKDYLKIEAKTTVEAGKEIPKPAAVSITVINKASNGLSNPRIVFDGVTLRIGIPERMTSKNLGTLSPSQSASFSYECTAAEVLDVQYDVTANINTQEFFKVTHGPLTPSWDGRFPVVTYVQVVRGADIHRWLQHIIRNLPTLDANTTLEQVEERRKNLQKTLPEIQQARDRLVRAVGLVEQRNRERTINHVRAVERYLEETRRAVDQLQAALGKGRFGEFENIQREAKRRLESRAEELDTLTVEMEKSV